MLLLIITKKKENSWLEDDFCSGCRNVSHHQQFFSELPSPGRSHNTNYWGLLILLGSDHLLWKERLQSSWLFGNSYRPRIEKWVGRVCDIRDLMPAVFGLIKNVFSGTKKPRFDFRKGNKTLFRKMNRPYSGYQSHEPFSDFFPSFGGRQPNASMTIVVFISCQFHGHVRSSLDQVSEV